MNYKGIFGFYDPITKTGEIYDGSQASPTIEVSLPANEFRVGRRCVVLSSPIITMKRVTRDAFFSRLEAEMTKEGESKV